MPPAPTAPPTAPAAPTGSANAASPSPSLANFDTNFGMDDGPEPTPEPSPSPEPEPSAPEPTPEPPQTPEPSPQPERPKDPVTGKFVPKAEPKVEPKKPEPKAPDEFTPPQVATGSQLRKFAEQAGQRARQAASELVQLRAEVQKLKTTPREDSSALAQQLAAAQQTIKQHEANLLISDYSKHPDYVNNYEAPYQRAVKEGYQLASELVVVTPKPDGALDENGKPTEFNRRRAAAEDFDKVYYAGDRALRREKAKELFGEDAPDVLKAVDNIREKRKAATEALNEHNAVDWNQKTTAQKKLAQEAQSQMFSSVIEDLQTKYPHRFGERDGDTEWNEERTKSLQISDMAFDGEERAKLTPQQNAILDAQIHLRAAHYMPEHKLRVRLEAENKQLKEELAQIRGSGPGKPAPTGTPSTNGKRKSWDAEFDERVGVD